MYSDISIETLETRIGWEKSLDTDFAIELDEEVLTADSRRKVNSFHQLVTVDNVYAAVQQIDMEAEDFNGFLSSVRKQSVEEVLTLIFDEHTSYDDNVDYSNLITTKPRLFDNAIGYCIVIKMLELFISSSRSNFSERNAKLSFTNLKLELEGVKNDKGFYVAKGIEYKFRTAITKAQKVIFPLEAIVDSKPIW
jgi:hypothetical protein